MFMINIVSNMEFFALEYLDRVIELKSAVEPAGLKTNASTKVVNHLAAYLL